LHEISLVKSLLQQVAQIAEQHQAKSIQEVRIEIGPLTGVEKLLVQEAFELLAKNFVGSQCNLIIEEIPLQGLCENCKNQIVIQDFQFHCPLCGSHSVKITGGDAFRLLDLTIDSHTNLN